MTATIAAAPPRLLLDTNVLLDVILRRTPWADDAARVLDMVARRVARGFVASHAVTTVHYIVEREVDRETAALAVADLLEALEVVALESIDYHRALAMQLADFEDALHVAACLRAGADYLVTRNERDFVGAAVATRTPAEVVALFGVS
ncbi:MAG TPA: PIN domain-containing protein [Gemmatimonadaceae bacterium]|nr:PIN domain-containing protein [Gemmatimonadaceae bacterium]